MTNTQIVNEVWLWAGSSGGVCSNAPLLRHLRPAGLRMSQRDLDLLGLFRLGEVRQVGLQLTMPQMSQMPSAYMPVFVTTQSLIDCSTKY